MNICGPGSVVGIATELRAGRSRNRIPVGRDFLPVHTGPVSHPASCTIGTGSFLVVKYSRSVLLTTHHLLVPWLWKSRAIPLPTLWVTTGPLTGTIYMNICLCGSCSGLTFRHRAFSTYDRHFATLQRSLFIYLINKYISLSDICLTMHH